MYDVVAPILRRAGAPATFFVNTAFLDGGGIAHYNALGLLLGPVELPKPPIAAPGLERFRSLLPPVEPGRGASLRARIFSIRQAQSALVRDLAQALEFDLDDYIRERQPYLSSEQVSSLLDTGFTIGAHSHDHYRYTELPLAKQIEQTQTSMWFLERRFGIKPRAFAFPYGDNGIGPSFFSAVFSEPLLDVTFGTAGLFSHFHPRNIERVSMEKTESSAAQILARQFARAAYFRLRGRTSSTPGDNSSETPA